MTHGFSAALERVGLFGAGGLSMPVARLGERLAKHAAVGSGYR